MVLDVAFNVKKPTPTLPDAQVVTSVRHYTDRLFAFRCTRPQSLRFR
jgi:ferredoxin/flavodoxin---NADP+ reductase